MTVQRASDQVPTTDPSDFRSLLERTCSRCYDVFRSVSRRDRVWCGTCRRRYGYPSTVEAVRCG